MSRLRFLRKLFYLKLLKTLFANADRILDVGCGSGEFVHVCQAMGKLCVGVDKDLKSLLEAKQLHSALAVYVLADMFHLPFRKQSFDAIFFSHVIEHITVREAILLLKAFKELSSLLVVVTPSYHRTFWTPGHIVAYTSKTLEKLFKITGCQVTLVTYDKAFILNMPAKSFPTLLVRILNSIPITRVKVNLLAVCKFK